MEKLKSIIRVKSLQNSWILHNARDAKHGKRAKPKQHNRPEEGANQGCSLALCPE